MPPRDAEFDLDAPVEEKIENFALSLQVGKIRENQLALQYRMFPPLIKLTDCEITNMNNWLSNVSETACRCMCNCHASKDAETQGLKDLKMRSMPQARQDIELLSKE